MSHSLLTEFHSAPTADDNTIVVEIDVNLQNTDSVIAGDDYYFGVSVDVDGTSLYTATQDFTADDMALTTDVRIALSNQIHNGLICGLAVA